MTLLEEIQAKCSPELIASRDHQAIADAVSLGRTQPSGLLIGKGRVIEVLGLEAANAFIDVIDNLADFRHVKGLLASGTLCISSPLVLATVQGFVPGVLTQEQADALMALGSINDTVSAAQTEVAMKDDNGAYK